jgi:hypothetical protein
LIAESLGTGTELTGVPVRVVRIWRGQVGTAVDGQPTLWTVLDFEAEDGQAAALATALSEAIDPAGPWYVDFTTAERAFVVFAGKVFRYPRGDTSGRAEAAAYARSIGVPESQTDWAA